MQLKLVQFILLILFALLVANCSHVVSNPAEPLEVEGAFHSSDDGESTYENIELASYFYTEMFESISSEKMDSDLSNLGRGQYLLLNEFSAVSNSATFYFMHSDSRQYMFSFDKEGNKPPKILVSSVAGASPVIVKAKEKNGRWYVPLDSTVINFNRNQSCISLFEEDGSAWTGKLRNVVIRDNADTYSLDFDVNLVVTGMYMGTGDKATPEKVAAAIQTRLNKALNPGEIHVRQVNVLYAKDHPLVGKNFPDDKPFILSRYSEGWGDSLGALARWPGHEGEFLMVIGYYVGDSDVLGFSPVSGAVYNGDSGKGAEFVSLATHWNQGASMLTSQRIANVAIHELGHFFGLSHTTELDAQAFDELDDTPECPNLGSKNYHDYECPDYNYIMFPLTGRETYTKFSPQQMDVMRRYLLLTPHK